MGCSRNTIILAILWAAVAVHADSPTTRPTTRPFNEEEAALVSQLQSEVRDGDRVAAARAIGWKHDNRFCEVLVHAMADFSVPVATAATKAMGDLGTRAAVDELDTAARDESLDSVIRVESCSQLSHIAIAHKEEGAVESLSDLATLPDGSIPRAAKIGLNRALAKLDVPTLEAFSASGSGPVRSQVAEALRGRGEKVGPSGAKPASTASILAAFRADGFDSNDLKLLYQWKSEQSSQVAGQIAGVRRSLASLNASKPAPASTSSHRISRGRQPAPQAKPSPYLENQRNNLRKQIRFLDAVRERIEHMTPADVGVAIEDRAASSRQQAQASHVTSKVAGAVSENIANMPTEHVIERDGYGNVREYDESNDGIAMLGFLFSAMSEANARQMEQNAAELAALIKSLSPDARAAIEKRRDEVRAAQTRGSATGLAPTHQ